MLIVLQLLINKKMNPTLTSLLFSLIISVSAFSQNGLIGSYPFNGNANDVSGNGNNGIVNGATLTADRFGTPNSAYLFNGTSNYINLGTNFTYGSHSFSCWARKDSITGSNTLVSKINNGPYDMQNSEFTINGFTLGTSTSWSSLNSVTPVVDYSQWNCYVVTYDAVTQEGKIYVNGVADSMNMGAYSDVSNTPIFIGARPFWTGNGGPAFFFMGAIDEVNIYNRVLTQQEVDSLCPSISMSVENMDRPHLSVYPNPSNGHVVINISQQVVGASITVTNSLGQIVDSRDSFDGKTLTLSLEGLPRGIYQLRITQDNVVVTSENLIISE